MFTRFGVDFVAEGVKPDTLNRRELGDAIFEKLKERYDAKEKLIGPDAMRHHERMIMLSVIDSAVERSPAQHGSPEGGHRAARLRPARSAGRVQEENRSTCSKR